MTDDIKYTMSRKKILAEKIQKIRNLEHIDKIKEIIYAENPNLSVTKNSSGILFYFHNLNEPTYKKLHKFVKHVDKLNKLNNDAIIATENYENYSQEISEMHTGNKFRLSNKEKSIIKRKQYEDEINGSELYVSEDNTEEIKTKKTEDIKSDSNLDNNINKSNIFIKKNK